MQDFLDSYLWLVFLLQLSSTGYMIGVIWMVQLVHYPLMALVHPDRFVLYEREHQKRMAFVVIPFMLIELVTAGAIVFLASSWWTPFEAWLGLGMLALVWVSTALFQAPVHAHLRLGYDSSRLKFLVNSNWVRTLLWTVRGVLVLLWFARAFTSQT